MNKLTLAKMHFIIRLSATINSIPEEVMKTTYVIDNTSCKKPGRSTDSGIRGEKFAHHSSFSLLYVHVYHF